MSIDRLYSASLHVMILAAVVPYAIATGGVAYLAAACLVVPLSFYTIEVRRQELASRQTTNLIIMAALAWGVFDFFQLTFLLAVANFLVVVLLAKTVAEKNIRDFYVIFAISIVLVCTSAALTTQLHFGVSFLAYLIAAIMALMLFTLQREAEGVVREVTAEESMSYQSPVRQLVRRRTSSGRGFLISCITLALLVFLGAVGVFVLFPRTGEPLVTRPLAAMETVTGFSETVALNDLGLILEEKRPVMEVKLRRGGEPYRPTGEGLYWRGVALSRWDGRGWYNDRSQALRGSGSLEEMIEEEYGTDDAVIQEVVIEPIDTNVVFALYRPVAAQTLDASGQIFVRQHKGLVTRHQRRKPMRYQVLSIVHEPTAEELRAAPRLPAVGEGGAGPTEEELAGAALETTDRGADTFDWLGGVGRQGRRRTSLTERYELFRRLYLSTEEIGPRVQALAEEIASEEAYDTDYDIAMALERYLRDPQNFDYTLDLRDYSGEGVDPIEEFLFDQRRGHCTLFASAMALMLRCRGIPSRIVNGFHGGRWNDMTESYFVYSNYAHSWVEAYFRGHGWVRFDPTPGSAAALSDQRYTASWFEEVQGWFQMQWSRRVISFAKKDQTRMYTFLQEMSQAAVAKMREMVGDKYSSLTRWSWKNLSITGRLTVAVICFALAVVVSVVIKRILPYFARKAFREDGYATGGTTLPRELRFYPALLEGLADEGYERLISVPPMEYFEEVNRAIPKVGAPLGEVTEIFCRGRYGHRSLSRGELRRARELSKAALAACRADSVEES